MLVSCMRTLDDSQVICACHLDDGGCSTFICCDPSCSTTHVDVENDFPPRSSSPPEVASSSPHSGSVSSDEEGSVETFMSASPFDMSSLPVRSLARNSDDFTRRSTHLELTPLEDENVKLGLVYSPSETCWSTGSSPTSSVLRTAYDLHVLNRSGSCPRICSHAGSPVQSLVSLTGFRDCSCTNVGPLDADDNDSASEGRRKWTKAAHVRPRDEDLPSPSNILESPPITFTSNAEDHML
jgi:hypothetical protein